MDLEVLDIETLDLEHLEIHELAAQFPEMSTSEFEALSADIQQNGLLEPIVIFQEKILDGRNRFKASKAAKYSFKNGDFVKFPGDEIAARQYSASANLTRRHLSKSQKAMFIAANDLAPKPSDRHGTRNKENSIREVAKRYGCNHLSVYKAFWVFEKDEKLARRVLNGEISVGKAELEIRAKSTTAAQNKHFEPATQDHKIYRLDDSNISVHVAAGDLLKMNGIDVLVNSENTYMQMARVFEGKTISSLLRYNGSELTQGQHLIQDTVQDELNSAMKDIVRPVKLGTIIPTTSGHESGFLWRSMKARFIFHAATIEVVGDGMNAKLRPIEETETITFVARSTLEKVNETNKTNLAKDPNFQAIESIYIPLFNTGRGNVPAAKVAPAIVGGIHRFIMERQETTLKRVYIGALTNGDVNIVINSLENNRFSKVN